MEMSLAWPRCPLMIWLMNHYPAVRQREPLPFGPRGQQNGTHARGHSYAICGDVAGQITHCVIYRHTTSHHATGRIDIHMDVLFWIIHLQEKQLG